MLELIHSALQSRVAFKGPQASLAFNATVCVGALFPMLCYVKLGSRQVLEDVLRSLIRFFISLEESAFAFELLDFQPGSC